MSENLADYSKLKHVRTVLITNISTRETITIYFSVSPNMCSKLKLKCKYSRLVTDCSSSK